MEQGEKLFTVGAIVAFSFAAGFLVAERFEFTETTSQEDFNATIQHSADLSPMWEAWRLLEEKFVPATTTKVVSDQEHVWGIIEGLAESYNDPYTVFLPPQQAQIFEEEIKGEFGGIGIEMGIRDEILTVIAPLKGTPADEAGLLSGDLILEVNGESTQSMTVDKAVSLIRGEIGTEVILTIAREGENEFLDVPIIRGNIEIPTIDTEWVDEGVFMISLYNFGGTAVNEFRLALREFAMSGNDKLILDLRGNPGGYLEAAVDIASWFLPLRKAVVIEDFGESEENFVHRSKGKNVFDDELDMVILIDGGSASASEILAGALQEHGIAVLIGETTFGKGSVQELINVTEETALKITIARWLTPNGKLISEVGLEPDLSIKRSVEDFQNDIDPHLDAAIQYFETGELIAPQTEEEAEVVEENEELE